LAYVPPELRDSSDYDFDTCSDMYSFGVLLYELLTEQVPFAGPDAAVAAQGKPAHMPSEVREGGDPSVDQLIHALLNVRDSHARPTATVALATLRGVLGPTTEEDSQAPTPPLPTPSSTADIGVGDIIDGLFRVDEVLGRGAFSRVLRVYH